MKVNLVGQKSWIIGKAIDVLKTNPIFVENEKKADFNYYLPYIKYEKTKQVDVAMFTHYEQISETDLKDSVKKATRFIRVANSTDKLISISKQTQVIIKAKTGRDSSVISFGTDLKKDVVFGVCGRTYKTGRKNEHFIKKLVELNYNVLSWGDDNWGCPNFSSDYKKINDFYSKIDYLIIPSSNEGGCVPMLEAIALGVPVIAPNVGWCWDYPCYRYERNDFLSLFKIILCLTSPPTWDQFLQNHILFFNSIYKK